MLLSFILIPFVTALLLLFIKNDKSANTIAIVSTLGTLVAAIVVAGNGPLILMHHGFQC
jgi:NADH:ubiquinone oxidoreductase subunit 4 (subunit M)